MTHAPSARRQRATPDDHAVNRGLLGLGNCGGPLPQSQAVQIVSSGVAAEMVRRGLLAISEPVYTLTDAGLAQYAEVSARRNTEADR